YSSYLFYEISLCVFPNSSEKARIYSIYIMCAWFWADFFIVGQVSSILSIILLLSLKYYLEGMEKKGSFLIGFSLFVKPISFLVIFFILIKDPKKIIKNIFYIILPLIPDAVFFIIRPKMLESFLISNLYYPSMINSYFARFNISTFFVIIGIRNY